MSLLWIIIAAAALGLAVFACGVALLAPRVQAAVRLRAALGLTAPRPAVSASAARVTSRMERMLARAARVLPASPKEAALTRQLLVQAGYREPQHNRMYSGLRAILVFAPLLLVLAAGWERHLPLLLAALPAVGWLLPRMLLRRLARRRAQRIALSLPDVLDLLVVCIEAGLGLEQAMQRVARELRPVHPCLCGELELVALQSRAGVARIDALRHLTQRCGVNDLRSLTAILIQADRFGTSVAQVLRIQSAALRSERRQRAEEAAAKLSIKMLPVLALFLFPAIMIVVLGPAALSLIRHLGPLVTR